MDASGGIVRLTEPQKRHLRELLGEDGVTFYWHPANSGERRCAFTLSKKGLLDSDYIAYHGPVYWLNERGNEVARDL